LEYEESLAKDREKTRMKEEADEESEFVNRIRKVEEESRVTSASESEGRRLREVGEVEVLLPADSEEVGEDVLEVAFRLPDGRRVRKKFRKEMGIETVIRFVRCRKGVWGEGGEVGIYTNGVPRVRVWGEVRVGDLGLGNR